ncbi:MAG: HEAT repeat domain-containing protein [Phycisphaerales bacterium]
MAFRSTVFVLMAAAGVAGVLCAGGCLSDASRKKASDSGSLLSIMGPPSPAEAAAMMADPFDADRRYKGVTWISNAPWGGADVYLRVYREMVGNDKEDPGVRAVAARALGFHGSPADAMLIRPLLTNDDKRVRQTAARALERLHNPELIPDLMLAVDPGDRVVARVMVLESDAAANDVRRRLQTQPGKFDLEMFAKIATESSKDPSAANGGLLGPVGAFNSPLPEKVRLFAARMAEGMVSPVMPVDGRFYLVAVEKRMTGEVDRDTREAAACALGQYSDPRALRALIATLNDDELSVSRRARQSLRLMTGHDSGDEPKDWQAWASAQSDPFAGRRRYQYPNFYRDSYWWEYIPFIPGAPNEPSGMPIGYRPPGS